MIFLSHSGTLNVVTIQTLLLLRTLNTLFLSLAVSEVGVGLVFEPFYASFLIKL